MIDGQIDNAPPATRIELSNYTLQLLEELKKIKERQLPDEYTKLQVSQAVSFLALVYEKIRNAIEYRDEHLIRRAAIERILKRRLAMNPEGTGEGENLLRELMWARYYPNGSLGTADIQEVQKIIDIYREIKKLITTGRSTDIQHFLSRYLSDLLTCEIEAALSPAESAREAIFNYFIFQTIKDKVKIEDINDDQKNALLLVALEKSFRKSDLPYQRYHIFTLFFQPLAKYSKDELITIAAQLPETFKKIDALITNPLTERLIKFTRRQLPPYLILFDIIFRKRNSIDNILRNRSQLWAEVDLTCRTKYQVTAGKLRILAIKSLVYIFLTKMLLALILEIPLSKLFYNEVNYQAIAINSVFPPIMMLVIILTTRLPGEDNTKRIFHRLVEIINADTTYEQRVALITKKPKTRRPILSAGFTIFYTLTFVITLFFIYDLLNQLKFNPLSMAIFIFFVSVVSFFSYRIRQTVNEYRLIEKDSIFRPIVDFFLMPLLALGKVFSEGVSQLNVFIVIFDFLIEAPFKLIIEVIEEWISFVRARKEEII